LIKNGRKKDMIKCCKRAISIYLIIILIILGSLPSILGTFNNNNQNHEIENLNQINKYVKVNSELFGLTGKSKRTIELPYSEAEILYKKIYKFTKLNSCEPFSDETKKLQEEILTIAKKYNLISKDFRFEQIQPNILSKNVYKYSNVIDSLTSENRGTAILCNFATAGSGSQFPIIILPRLIPILLTPIPRPFMHWSANDGITSCGSHLTGKGFIAVGMQRGTAIGFWGIGFSIFLPPFMNYGFIGYSLYTTCNAETIEPWPPNYPPEISAVSPIDGEENVPISTSELIFQINDENNDLLNYSVTTFPDIGSESQNNIPGGTYSVPISGLEGTEKYSWEVIVSDGRKTTKNEFSFTTESVAPTVSDPNPSDGEKYVSINLDKITFKLKDPQGDLMDYTVETVPDIGSGNGFAVGEGTYSINIDDLEHLQNYKWFVNVTDGEYWKHKIYNFQCEPKMIFDPFIDGWTYRKKLIIDKTNIIEDLNEYTVLISTIDSDLKSKTQSSGNDILFMNNSGIAKRLYHEIEKYDDSTGEIVAWVNIPHVYSEKNTSFYIYYGNPYCKNQQTSEKTWDSYHKAVFHMREKEDGIFDSTKNKNNCETVIGNPNYNQIGKIGNAIEFEKSYEEAFEDGDIFDGLEEMTVEAWINLESYHSSHCMIASHEDAWYFHVHREFDAVIFGTHGGVHNSLARDNIKCPLDQWYYVAGSWSDSQDRMQLFANGILKDTYIEELSMQESDDHFAIGYQDNSGNHFDGKLDEIRISNIERSESWLSTNYKNQNEPYNFISFGPEENNS
jgi:hypothetical protein